MLDTSEEDRGDIKGCVSTYTRFVLLCLSIFRWRWFTIDVPPSSLDLVLRWLLFYLVCSSIVILLLVKCHYFY